MYQVSAQRIRGTDGGNGAGRVFGGYLLAVPEVGNALVIFRKRDDHRFVSTEIIRVLGSNECLFVETANSTYRLRIFGRVVYEGCEQSLEQVAIEAIL